MDSDAIDASSLCSVYQPLDVLQLELQNEPAFRESTMPKDDHTLTRFLKARGYNASQAKQMILDCIHWRRTVEDVGIEELYRRIDPFDFPGREQVFESWPMGYHKVRTHYTFGDVPHTVKISLPAPPPPQPPLFSLLQTDKLGRPIHIQSFGAISPKRLYQHITPQEHWCTVLVNIEALLAEVLPAASAAAGRPIRQALVIVDLKGFGLSQFWSFKSIARRFFEVSQNYFPETMGQLIIINAPTSFTAIWSVIKPWLAPRTLDKISILGANNPDQHAAFLLDLISPENLPATLGGTCTCSASASGCTLSNAGPWMDGRTERRARWLHGETSAPSVPWPLPQKKEKEKEHEREHNGADAEEATTPTTTTTRETKEEACQTTFPAVAAGAGVGTNANATASPSPSCARVSVVGLPLPLAHPPPPAAVRLVV
ncbi:CRAL-TRIO domain-containing protein [Russula compacta]|nr:CRAL-TRIO domain-containing protein [Russula compacta]